MGELKFPFLEIRREGKNLDDGYGAPQDTYEEPKPSYSTTVSPCGYKPTTTTTTEAPQYGAPRQQNPVFPDIFGFIGDKIGDVGDRIGDILKPKHENNNTPYDCLSAPEEGYGVPQATAYEAPTQESNYEAPQADSYEAPQADTYEAPQADSYEAPHADSYEAPQADTYEA